MKKAVMWICLVVSLCCANAVAVLNPGFEQAIYGVSPYCNPPADWSYENYANVVSSYIPQTERAQVLEWQIDAPCEGSSFLVLATGCMGDGSDSTITSSKVYQEVTFQAGQTLSFNWFFGTSDYRPYYDCGLASLVPVDPADNLNTIEIVRISVNDVGDFGATDGWQYASFTFDASNAGRYYLVFEVNDVSDNVYESYFAIDNIIPEPATMLLLGVGGLLLRRRK